MTDDKVISLPALLLTLDDLQRQIELAKQMIECLIDIGIEDGSECIEV